MFSIAAQTGLYPFPTSYTYDINNFCLAVNTVHIGAIGYHNLGVHPFPSTVYFNCFGNESSLSSCRSSSTSSCRSDNTAGVFCRGEVITSKNQSKIVLFNEKVATLLLDTLLQTY